MEVLEKGVRRAGKGYNNMGYMAKQIFSSAQSFKHYEITQYFNYELKFNSVSFKDNLL